MLRKAVLTDTDVATLNNLVEKCTLETSGVGQRNTDLEKDVLDRESKLRAEIFAANSTVPPKLSACQDWLDALQAAPAAAIDPREYTTRDTVAVKLRLILDYMRANGSNLAGFVQQLRSNDWDVFRVARLELAEIVERVDAAAIVAALQAAGALEIAVSVQDAAAMDALTLSACFTDAGLNRAAARVHFTPTWTFGHEKSQETGWDVRHYFPNAGSYSVTVTVTTNGKALPGAMRAVDVRAPLAASRKRVGLQVARTALLMVLSAVALQRTTLASVVANANFVSAVLGAFASGFVIDTVKGGFDAIRARVSP